MPPPLRRNRDFQLLWAGQVVSDLGTRIAAVAFPLLVLALTGSPAWAGFVAFAGALPTLLFTLPAGALLDRWDRKRSMLACDAARALAFASIPAAALVDDPHVGHLAAVAFVDGTGWVFFHVAERAALKQIVPPPQLAAAISQNQARSYAALLGGPPLGGLLFGLGRLVPFIVDAVSFALSFVSLLFVRGPLQEAREPAERDLRQEVAEGLRFLWGHPFLRTTSLLVTGSELVLNALFLVVIVLAKENGASAGLVGAMLLFVGIGGVIGSALAPLAARRLSPRTVVVGSQLAIALLVPLLVVVDDPIALGVVFGGMFVAVPTWNAVVSAYRTAIVPDRLQGRVVATVHLIVGGAVPAGVLAVGVALEVLGSTATVLALAGVMAAVVFFAVTSRAIRDVPPLAEA